MAKGRFDFSNVILPNGERISIEPKTDSPDPEMLAHQLAWYQYYTMPGYALPPGDYKRSEPVWLFDKPYIWFKENGQLTLLPDRYTRHKLHYKAAKQFVDDTVRCEVCDAD